MAGLLQTISREMKFYEEKQTGICYNIIQYLAGIDKRGEKTCGR